MLLVSTRKSKEILYYIHQHEEFSCFVCIIFPHHLLQHYTYTYICLLHHHTDTHLNAEAQKKTTQLIKQFTNSHFVIQNTHKKYKNNNNKKTRFPLFTLFPMFVSRFYHFNLLLLFLSF
eukprot:UN04466